MASSIRNALVGSLTTPKGLAVVLPIAALSIGLLMIGAKSDPVTAGGTVATASEPPANNTAPAPALSSTTATGAPLENTPTTKIANSSAAAFSPAQKSAIETIIKKYLLKNPEIMLAVQQALQDKSEKLEAERLKVVIKQNANELFHRPNSAVAGNPKGDVTLVEFFDYNCGFCKRAFDNVAKLLEADKNMRIVFKEFPILSKGSEEAARVALAARAQGKYWQVHKALLSARGRANAKTALKIASKLGLDMEKLKRDMTSPEVEKEISDTRKLAQEMGINGTPHFVIGDKVIAGAPQNLLQEIEDYAADIRKNGCAVC